MECAKGDVGARLHCEIPEMEQARPEPALWLFSEFHHLQREVEMLARQRDELAAQLRSERQERATLSATLSSARAALKLLLSENNLLTRELAEFDVMCCYDEPVAMEQPIKQYPDTQARARPSSGGASRALTPRPARPFAAWMSPSARE